MISRRRFHFISFRPIAPVFRVIGTILGQKQIYKKSQPLNISKLALFKVPRAGIEPARPFRAKGFSYHYGFRHHFCLWSGLFLHRGARLFRCVVSSLCTFLLSEAWLKIAIGFTRYGFLEFTTFYISLFRECTQIMSKSLVSTISPPRHMGDCGYKDNEFFLNRKPRPAPYRQGRRCGFRPTGPERRLQKRVRSRRGTCAVWRRWPGRRWFPG